MKLSEKLKRVRELEKKVRDGLNSMHEEHKKKFGPLEKKARELKQSVLNEKDSITKEIRKDVKKFVSEMKKKYRKLKKLELISHVLYFGTNVEIAVDFEIDLEDLIKYEESKLKKPKRPRGRIVKESEISKKIKKKIVGDKK